MTLQGFKLFSITNLYKIKLIYALELIKVISYLILS